MESKTPRTDDREFAAIDLKPSSRVVYASFARQLETELAEARAEIERKNALIEQMRVALAWLYQWTKNEVEHFGAAAPDDEIIKDVEAALSAAERGDEMSDTSHYDDILFQEKLRAAETENDCKLFSMLHPRLFIDGDQWCCLYGEDLQTGLVGFRKSPIAAIRQWNAEWYKTLSAAERGK